MIVPPLSSMIFSREVRAAPLAGGRVGMTWLSHDNTTFMDVLMSNTIEAPFDTWPPAVNPAVQAFSADLISNHPGPIESRVDGTFAVGPGPRGIFAFEHTGPVSPFGDRWAQAFPEPAPSSGVLGVAFDSSSLTYTLESCCLGDRPERARLGAASVSPRGYEDSTVGSDLGSLRRVALARDDAPALPALATVAAGRAAAAAAPRVPAPAGATCSFSAELRLFFA